MRGFAGFLLGVIVGLIAMFGLVKQGYIRTSAPSTLVLGQTPEPSPQASVEQAPTATAPTAAATGSAPSTPAASAAPTELGTPAGGRIAGNTFVWNGPKATITYSFQADGTYEASYNGAEGETRIVGISKGSWTRNGTQLATHETSGVTQRTTGAQTTTRPAGAGDVTFTVGSDGRLTDGKGRVYQPLAAATTAS